MCNNHDRISKILSDNADVKNLKPMYLDTEDLVTNRAMHEDSISKYYVETYFSIVSETTYHEGTPFLSEKIFKAIAMGHPFIIVTAPNSLQYLKALGYKTYSPFIDESYDSIQDDGDRMLAILDQIEKLCSMPKKTLRKQWLPNVRTIANHNRNLLLKNYSKDLCVPMNY